MSLHTTRCTLIALFLCVSRALAAHAQILVSSANVMEHAARPGERYDSAIEIRNTSSTLQTVSIRVADYSFQADGTTRYDEPGTRPRSSARWLTLSTRSLEIPPLQVASVRYTIQVPADDALRGSYASLVLVAPSTVDEGPAAASRGARTGAGLRTRLSFGVQIATHIAGPASSRFGLEQLATRTSSSGEREIALTVRNAGERAQRPVVSLDLYRDDGQLVATRRSQRGLIYPGSSVRQTFTVVGVPSGTYRALIQVDTGEEDVFAVQPTVRFSP
jgi:hypothetical protein